MAAPQENNQTLARVNGTAISSRDVRVEEDQAVFNYRLSHSGKNPQPQEIERLTKELREKMFIEKLRKIIWRQKVTEFKIAASDAEVNARWQQITNGIDAAAWLEKQRALDEPLLEALKAVYEKGEDSHDAYNRFLKSKMSEREWAGYLHYFSTLKRRNMLVKDMAQTREDLRHPAPGVREMVLQEKLEARIDADLAGSDPRFADYQSLAKKQPSGAVIATYPPNYLTLERDKWWWRQYRDAKVEINDPDLMAAWRSFISQR